MKSVPCCWSTWRTFSGLVAAGLHPNPCEYADIVTSTTHKTLRGPRSGIILANEKYGKAIDQNVFPGAQGGPLVHVIAAKAVCFLEALQPEFRRISAAGDRQRAGARRGHDRTKGSASFPAAPTRT